LRNQWPDTTVTGQGWWETHGNEPGVAPRLLSRDASILRPQQCCCRCFPGACPDKAVRAPTSVGGNINEFGFASISGLIAAADASLNSDAATLSASAARAYQEALKIAFDAMNNQNGTELSGESPRLI
jgi:hypothetical protein